MSFTMKYFIDKIQGHWQNSSTGGGCRPSNGLCTLWLELFLVGLASFFFFFFLSPDESFKSLWDLWWWDISHPLQRGSICEAGGVLEPWESVAGALEPFFLRVALVELPWLPLPSLPLLGLPSEPAAGFLATNPMHTFLWLCRVEDDMKACFRHFPHP